MRYAPPLLCSAAALLLTLTACDRPAPPRATPPASTSDTTTGATADTTPSTHTSGNTSGATHAAINVEDPRSCAPCHQAVYDEWTESMHSRAHHENDPIYGGMRALRMKKQGAKIAGKCAKCHNARSPMAPDTLAGRAGVSCATCHNVAQVHIKPGVVGVDALTWDQPGVMRSARELKPGASPAHGTGPALAAMQDGKTLCLSCHNATKTPAGAAACTTGPEFHAGVKAAPGATCVSCHMPTEQGPAGAVGRQKQHVSHRFLGPHRAWYQKDASILKAAVALDGTLRGETLGVTLKNQSVHAFPSGFPGRMVVVKVVGKSEGGEVVWQNFKKNPMAEHRASVLNKVYHDKQGQPAPAPFAEKLVSDTRLKPGETRTITYAPPASVASVEVSILYRLLPPPLAKKLGVAGREEATPRVITRRTIQRSP